MWFTQVYFLELAVLPRFEINISFPVNMITVCAGSVRIIQGLSKRFEHLLLWPPRSPDLTPCDFFLWGYVKDNAYKPPLPQNVRELQGRIRAAVQTIDGNMMKPVWQERLSY